MRSRSARHFASLTHRKRTGGATARWRGPLPRRQTLSDVPAHFCRTTRSGGKGQPSVRARVRTLTIFRLRAAAALTTDAPWATRALSRSSSSFVQVHGRFLEGMVCPVLLVWSQFADDWQETPFRHAPALLKLRPGGVVAVSFHQANVGSLCRSFLRLQPRRASQSSQYQDIIPSQPSYKILSYLRHGLRARARHAGPLLDHQFHQRSPRPDLECDLEPRAGHRAKSKSATNGHMRSSARKAGSQTRLELPNLRDY
jgi:hypothetical protein